jgi:hypothetical protein
MLGAAWADRRAQWLRSARPLILHSLRRAAYLPRWPLGGRRRRIPAAEAAEVHVKAVKDAALTAIGGQSWAEPLFRVPLSRGKDESCLSFVIHVTVLRMTKRCGDGVRPASQRHVTSGQQGSGQSAYPTACAVGGGGFSVQALAPDSPRQHSICLPGALQGVRGRSGAH